MALGSFLAGRFSGSYDPVGATAAGDIGITEQGYDLNWQYAVEAIKETDQFGEQFIDGVFRGISQCFMQCDSLEWKAGVLNAVAPYGATALAPSGATFLTPGIIGRLMSDVAGILIMTSTAGTPSAASPATWTATFAIISENFDIKMLLNSKLRKVPIRFRLLPYIETVTKYFTAT